MRDGTLEVRPGEVHGLVGENGAGKSTLINIATGVLRADGGTMTLHGAPVSFATPRAAARAGIAVVHQEADLFPQLSLAENMLLRQGLVRNRLGLVDWRATRAKAAELVAAMGESFSVDEPAARLSVARRMMAEIAAALAEDARVLFLDEPTASLTANESERLFAQIARLKAEGVGIVYVSHRLDEVLRICDRVTVLRDGETVACKAAAEFSVDSLVAAMVGREAVSGGRKAAAKPGALRLDVANLTSAEGLFHDVSLRAHAGEIVGVYGFVGAGRSEFAQAVFGLRPVRSGTVSVDGAAADVRSARRAVASGIAYLPEDRLVQGVFRGHSVRANVSAAVLPRLSRFTLIGRRAEKTLADEAVDAMRIRAASIEQPIGALSGGNQQKAVFARWQATDPKVLLLDEPTRGVDVGAKAEIHRLIADMAERGAAVVMISSELPEIMGLSDRVVTFCGGRVTGEFDPRRDSEALIAAAAVPQAAVAAPAPKENAVVHGLVRFREAGLLAFVAALCAMMLVLRPGEFATVQNLLDILANAALPAILAMGAMLIICAGGIDISIGSMMGLVGAVAALAAKSGSPPLLCLAFAIAMGAMCSLANGGVALLARIHPIIVTLAGIGIYRGAMRLATGQREVEQLPAAYRALAEGDWFGLPKLVYYVVAVTLATHLILRYTLTGRRVLALGNSENAARLIGLSKTRLTLFVFAFGGALVGLAAVLHAGYYGKVQANTGEGWELRAIAAAVIGGTNILGGRGSALGTLLGAVLVALLYNMLVLLAVPAAWSQLAIGALILGAVVFDVTLQRLRSAGP